MTGDHELTTQVGEKRSTHSSGVTQLWINDFLSGPYASFITLTPIRLLVLLVYAGYLALSIYGFLNIKEGIENQNLAPSDSYVVKFYDAYDKYYKAVYGPTVMVLVLEPLDYTKPLEQAKINALLQSFRNSKYFYDDGIKNWLEDFEEYLSKSNRSTVTMTGMDEFISILRTEFFSIPLFQYYQEDVQFDANYTQILASRYFAQGSGGASAQFEKDLMLDARHLAKKSSLSVSTFNIFYMFFDQYAMVTKNTLKNTGIAIASMLFVSLLLIPSLIAVVWVLLAVLSISLGIVGIVSLWGVALDGISMICIIMCIGFSVDFAAHISYHYVVSDKVNGLNKLRDALRELGYPILQSGISTLLGVSVLSTNNSYTFLTFFKFIFLVMVLGFFHALILLPVLMPVLSNCCQNSQKQTEDKEPLLIAKQYEKNHIPKTKAVRIGIPNPTINNISYHNSEPYVTKIDLNQNAADKQDLLI